MSLSFTDCQGIAVLFEENRYTTFRASKLETICFTGTNTPETGKGELLEAFYYLWAASISGRYIELELAGCRRNETVLAFTRTCVSRATWDSCCVNAPLTHQKSMHSRALGEATKSLSILPCDALGLSSTRRDSPPTMQHPKQW